MKVMKQIQHESTTSRDHRKLHQIIKIIEAAGVEGIKKGTVIVMSGVPFNQWQFWHPIITAHEKISYDKQEKQYIWLG